MKYPVTYPMSGTELVRNLGLSVIFDRNLSGHNISYLCNISVADGAEALAFCSYAGDKGFSCAQNCAAEVLICDAELAQLLAKKSPQKSLIAAKDARLAFAIAASILLGSGDARDRFFFEESSLERSHSALDIWISPTAMVGQGCAIGRGSCVGPGSVLYPAMQIGDRCQVEAGVSIGGRGFGFVRDEEGELFPFPQLGRVVVGHDVAIGARTSIDRGSMQDTTIGSGTKIDDFAYIAHNVSIGRNCLIMAGAVLCGGCKIGDGAELAPGVIVRENVNIGARARVGLGAVVTKDVPPDELVAGVPARPFQSR